MPELPDIEVFKRYLEAVSLHKKIKNVDVKNKKALEGISTRKLKENLKGKEFLAAFRHGKNMFVKMDDDFLLFHFGMTGRLKYFKDIEKTPEHTRILFSFTNGYHLAYVSMRMLGKVMMVKEPQQYIKQQKLGPDVLMIDKKEFIEKMKGRRGVIKSALMNQQIFAGIGNVYSDEALFQARMHPKTEVKELTEKQLADLFDNIKETLEKAIDVQADPGRMPSHFVIPHRRGDGLCPRDGKKLEKVKVNQRSAYVCPQCQKISG